MAVTKILPRNGGLKEAIDYVLNGDKTDGHILRERVPRDDENKAGNRTIG